MGVQENLSDIKMRIAAAAERAGRPADAVKLVAVSKMTGMEEIAEAVASGQHDFGENRAPQLKTRETALPEEKWHMIGRLQTNKVKDAVEHACMIHSVDRFELAEEISKRAVNCGKVMDCLLEVSIAGEEQKAGIAPEAAENFLRAAEALPGIRFLGLMTMAPAVPEGEGASVRYVFQGLKALFDQLKTKNFKNTEMRELSMGMSNDFEIAVEEGATIVRVGSAIFPKRL